MKLTYLRYDQHSHTEELVHEEVPYVEPTIKHCSLCKRFQVPGFPWGNHPELLIVRQEYLLGLCPDCRTNRIRHFLDEAA